MKYDWVYTKVLEREKVLALAQNFKNVDAQISLHDDLFWWENTISSSFNNIKNDLFRLGVFTYASLTGWGACCGFEKTHGF